MKRNRKLSVKELLEIKDTKREYSNYNDAYCLHAKEVAKFLNVPLQTVYSSREHHPTQQIKRKKCEEQGKRFVTDKLDMICCFAKLQELLK